MKTAVRSAARDSAGASEELEARLTTFKPQGGTGRLVWMAAAAVAAIAAGGLAVRGASRPEAFEIQLVGDHVLNALNHEKPLQVLSDDPLTIEKWFEGKLDFDVKLPRLSGATLLGGRLCSVGGRRVALTFYERGDHLMSLFVMEKTGPDRGCAEGVRGFTLCRRGIRGLEYALVTDLPKREADPLLLGALAQHRSLLK